MLHPGLTSAVGWLFLAAAAAGQEPPATFSVDAPRVLVNASVLDDRAHYINDLRRSDFRLYVDRRQTPVRRFWREDVPVSAVVVLDASGSMRRVLSQARGALAAFLDHAYEGDEYALVLCREQAQLAVPFTTRPEDLAELRLFVEAKGSTPLYDSMDLALRTARRGRNARKVIVVISDGEENASRLTAARLRKQLAEADATVYVIHFWTGGWSDFEQPWNDLVAMAEETGGQFFKDARPRDLPRIMKVLDVHQQYLMTFVPGSDWLDGRRHSIRLMLDGSRQRGHLRVYFRHWFRADPVAQKPGVRY